MKALPEKPWYISAIVAFLSHDVPELLGIGPAAVARDIDTLERRVSTEGESFLTKTLPSFGKSFDYALQERSPLSVSGFKKRGPRSALPAFLQALTGRVFFDDGRMLDEPCILSITAVRQLCYWCKKIEKGFSDESLQTSTENFIAVDNSLPDDIDFSRHKVLVLARAICRRIFRNIPDPSTALPGHGPGSVAWSTGDAILDKRRLRVSYTTLERYFRPIPFFASLRDVSENPWRLLSRWQTEYGLSRLAFVEKNSSGPRLIGLEPAEYMWCQQALKKLMYSHIERASIAKGRINFTDQSVNRSLALDWRRYDTLDMTEASDRNSLALVKFIFGGINLLPWLLACRTPGVVLPNGKVHMYKKFAPMGSAVCFPVEAVVFYCLAVATLIDAGYPFLLAHRNTFVYGDDLIVPHGYFDALVRNFEAVGLKFSDAKCCVSGKFRESCGVDAYDGVDVTPIRLRKPHLLRGTLDLASLVEHANELYKGGYWAASRRFRVAAKKRFIELSRMALPLTNRDDLPILAWRDCQSTVRFFEKNSMVYTVGYMFRPTTVRATGADEHFYLRESLITGGPVGELRSPRGQKVRSLSLRFAGSYVKRRVVVPLT